MSTQSSPYISVEEYLAQEVEALDRHEYLNGEIFAMSGGTPAHSAISTNIATSLGGQLATSDCTVRGADMRIRAAPSGLYSYADVVVSCADEHFENDTLLNPILIVEVLSKSTESYDRGVKFEKYRQIPSFREYLVVAQDRMYLEHHAKNATIWNMQTFSDRGDVISLRAVNASLPLAQVYAKVL